MKLRSQLNSNEHLLRSLAVHVLFAQRVVLGGSGVSTSTSVDEVQNALREALDAAWENKETENKEAENNEKENNSLRTLLTHTSAFAVLASMLPDSPRAKAIRRKTARGKLLGLFEKTDWFYQIRFKGRKNASVDGSPFNGAFCHLVVKGDDLELVTVDPNAVANKNVNPPAFAALEAVNDVEMSSSDDGNELESTKKPFVAPKSKLCRNVKLHGSCRNEKTGCPYNHTPSIESNKAHVSTSITATLETASQTPKQQPPPPPEILEIKDRLSHLLNLKTQCIDVTLAYLLTLNGKPIPLVSLYRHIRRQYYIKYIIPLSQTESSNADPPYTAIPHFNLGVLPTDPEYDMDDSIPDTTEEESARQNSIAKKNWPSLWHDWNCVRGILSKQFLRRLIHEQYGALYVDVKSCSSMDASESPEYRFVYLDVIEENSVRDYPWIVLARVVTDENAVEACKRARDRAADILKSIKIMMDNAVKGRGGIVEDTTISEIGDQIQLDTDVGLSAGAVLDSLNQNLVLLEMENRLDGFHSALWKRVRNLLGDEKAMALKRRNALKESFLKDRPAGLDIDDDSEEDDDENSDIEKEEGIQSASVLKSMDEKLFAGYSGHIETLLSKISPPRTMQPHRQKFLANLQSIITRAFGPGYTAHLFGSSVTTLATSASDADVTILLDDPTENPASHPISNMYLLGSVLRHHGMQKVFPVATAKVPIVKFYDPIYKLHADVNVGNALGIENSRLIREYMLLDDRVRDLILLIKYWAARRDLNDSAEGGTFSSYALTLMLLSYLQLMNVLPSLQALYPPTLPRQYIISRTNAPILKSTKSKADAKAQANAAFTEYKQRLSTNSPKSTSSSSSLTSITTASTELSLQGLSLQEISTHQPNVSLPRDKIPANLETGLVLWDTSFVTHDQVSNASSEYWGGSKKRGFASPQEYYTSIAHLLHGFFTHYGYTHRFNSGCIISVRCGGVISRKATHSKLNVGRGGGKKEGHQVVVVEDPFQLDRNTAGMVKQVNSIVAEFRRAALCLEGVAAVQGKEGQKKGGGGGGGGVGKSTSGGGGGGEFGNLLVQLFAQYDGEVPSIQT